MLAEFNLSDKFIAADNLLRSVLDPKHHCSIQVPQYNLGRTSPVQFIANGGKLETILLMFPKHNIGG